MRPRRFPHLELALSTIRGRAGGFVGSFVALLCGAAVITACGILLESGLRSGVPTERYAGTSVVVAASQSLPVVEDFDLYYSERALLAADLADDVADIPGVRSAIPERTFQVNVVDGSGELLPGGLGDDPRPVLGHGWSSAALAPFALLDGSAPHATDEVVLDAAMARRAGVGVGDTIAIAVGSTPVTYLVVGVAEPAAGGLARQSAVFFTDGAAAELSGRPDQVAAIGVLAEPGTDPDDLAARISTALRGDQVVTYSRDDAGDVEFLDVGQSRAFLVALSAAFGGSVAMIVMLIVSSTMALSIQQRRREIALLRAIAATPRQVHRLIGAETLLLAGAGGLAGVAPGIAVAYLLRGAFVASGVLPGDFELAISPLPMVAAIVLCGLTARGAGWIAGFRPARINPVEARGEAAVEPPRLGRTRLAIGWTLVPLAITASVLLPLVLPGEAAVAGGASSVLLLIIAIALLGPQLVAGVTRRLRAPLSARSPVSGYLAAANTQANSRRLAAAITPLVMAIAMASVQIFGITTTSAAAEEQAETGVVADFVLGGTASGISPEVASAAGQIAGVSTVTPVVRTQVMATFEEAGGQMSQAFAAQGVTAADLDRTMDLDPREGDLGRLTGDTVALSWMAAETIGVGIGDRVDLRLGDGTAATPTLVAIYGNGLGFGDVTLPHDVVAAHTTDLLDTSVLVRANDGADLGPLAADLGALAAAYPGVVLADRASFAAAQKGQLAAQSGPNLTLNAVLLAYIAIAVVNTLVMATAARGREFALLQLVGTSRRQVKRMMRTESWIVVGIAAVIGSMIAVPPLVGMSLGLTESPIPSIPPLAYAGILAVTAILGFASIVLPTRMSLRQRPVDAIGVRD